MILSSATLFDYKNSKVKNLLKKPSEYANWPKNFPPSLTPYIKKKWTSSVCDVLAGWVSDKIAPIKFKPLKMTVSGDKTAELLAAALPEYGGQHYGKITAADVKKGVTKTTKDVHIFQSFSNSFVVYKLIELEKYVGWGTPENLDHKAYFSAFLITVNIAANRVILTTLSKNPRALIREIKVYKDMLNRFTLLKGPIKGVRQQQKAVVSFGDAKVVSISSSLGKIYTDFVKNNPDFRIKDHKVFANSIAKLYKFRGQ